MTRQSSHTVTYKDWVLLIQRALKEAQTRLDGARSKGVTNLEALRHNVETASSLLKAVKRCEPGQQANLFEKYQQVK